jgi:hypothetical protein
VTVSDTGSSYSLICNRKLILYPIQMCMQRLSMFDIKGNTWERRVDNVANSSKLMFQ